MVEISSGGLHLAVNGQGHYRVRCVCACMHTCTHRPDLHGEVSVTVVVGEHIANGLVEQAEQRAKGTQSREVHHVVKTHRELKTLGDKSTGAKVWL